MEIILNFSEVFETFIEKQQSPTFGDQRTSLATISKVKPSTI